MTILEITELKREMTDELERRRCPGREFSYAQERGAAESLYGLTGAVNVLAALGLPLGSRPEREQAAARILAWRNLL